MILDTIRRFLARPDVAGPFLLAVSGGADSTALLAAFAEIGDLQFEAAHVNHHLRGAESDADEAFVRALGERYQIPLHVVNAPLEPDEIRRSGVESAARRIRYAKLREISGATIVTAHHKNDQAETVLMRLVNGGGIASLRGIHPIRADGVIRPLLTVKREDIDRFLAERGITARIDRSNADPRFLRNRIRAVLRQLDASAIDNLASIADQARDQWTVLERAIDAIDNGTATDSETHFASLPDDPWLRRALLHRHILRLDPGARDISADDLERLADETAKRVSVTKSLEMTRTGQSVTICRLAKETEPFEFELRAGEFARTPAGTIRIYPSTVSRQPSTQYFELPKGAEPRFTIRNRRTGDRFQPLGMNHQKKLKDFLIDRKIPAAVRDSIPLVLWNGAIIWVAGVEISEAFKVAGAGELYEVSIGKGEEDQEGVQRQGHRDPYR